VSAVNVVVQVDVAAPLVARAQGLGTTVAVEPAGWPVTAKLTVPCGGLWVPGAVSVTVTVQVAGAFAGVDAGQSSVVAVVRAITVIVALPLLEPWTESGAGVYVAPIV